MSFLISKMESMSQIDDFYEVLEKKMEKPQEVAFKIEEKKIKEKKRNISTILNVVAKKIDEHNGILYGGYALNELLPKHLQFYVEDTIPDYDFFVKDAEAVSKDIADKLNSKKKQYTEVRYAMHEGTYKVFSNFESVADVTQISTYEYDTLLKNSIRHKVNYKTTVKLAPIEFLKAVAYLELCLPIGSSFRWTKTFERILRFEKANPLKETNSLQLSIEDVFKSYELPQKFKNIHKICKQYIKLNELVYINLNAVNVFTHLDNKKACKKASKEEYILPLEILSDDISLTLNDITSKLRAYNFNYKISSFESFKTFIPKKKTIAILNKETNRYHKFASIYDATERCFAYLTRNNTRYVSIYFLMYIYYFKDLIEEKDENKVILHKLYKIMNNENTHAKLINLFTDKCFGKEHTMSAIKKNRWENKKRALFYRP